MNFTISEVSISDAETIARHVEVPSMLNGPLFKTTFPSYETFTEIQKEEVVQWYTQMLAEAFEEGKDRFLKASLPENGMPVGFCGWTIITTSNSGSKDEADSGKTNDEVAKTVKPHIRKQRISPAIIDVDSWCALSDRLRAERDRVLEDLDNVCRLTCMAVQPKYQRQNIGSTMMTQICEEMDLHNRYGYVLAAPESVRLYSKVGFKVVGEVETAHGPITSMLRPARSLSKLTSF